MVKGSQTSARGCISSCVAVCLQEARLQPASGVNWRWLIVSNIAMATPCPIWPRPLSCFSWMQQRGADVAQFSATHWYASAQHGDASVDMYGHQRALDQDDSSVSIGAEDALSLLESCNDFLSILDSWAQTWTPLAIQ